jgi:ribulose-bisphosphate carboxylase large chain
MTGERFSVIYYIRGEETLALEKAKTICLEQTVELEADLVPTDLRDWIVGRLEQFTPVQEGVFAAQISYAVETSAFELPQLLNVIFGNTSIKAGIRVEHLELGEGLLKRFTGPRFGIQGLRQRLGVHDRPLLCSALKPMGKAPRALAELAYALALGGIDLIKDDHGLTDQPFCPYRERVQACAEAVASANAKTDKHCLYVPNVTAPVSRIAERVQVAQELGAGGLLLAPGLTGFDTLRTLAEDETVDLPLISHPALLGSMVTSQENGFSHAVLFGQLQRLAGADASIYPNYGGRFAFSREECARIAHSCRAPLGNYPPIFPTPGGGMTLERIPDLLALYGKEVMFLMGGGLYGRSPDLVANARYFLDLVGQ